MRDTLRTIVLGGGLLLFLAPERGPTSWGLWGAVLAALLTLGVGGRRP